MTNEEWDRKVEFLLNQQAKFDAGMQELNQKLKEAQAISEQKVAKAAEAAEHALEGVSQLTDITTHLTRTMTDGFLYVFDSMKQTNDKIDVLVNSQIRTDDRLRDADERLRDIDKRQQDLAAFYERHIRKYHRGGNGSEN